MKPIKLPRRKGAKLVIFAKDQPEYRQLPALYRTNDDAVLICWQMTWRERLSALVTGKLFQQVLTFGKPLQPIRIDMAIPMDWAEMPETPSIFDEVTEKAKA